MSFPTQFKTWGPGFLLNQRISFTSLLDTTGSYITGITNQRIARGCTASGSSNGTVGAMDGVNRCTNAAGFAVRASIAGAPQSWIVISDGTVQTLYTFQGSSDDVARISFSPGSLFVAAGTPTNQPTATDEQVVVSSVSLVGSSPSQDRVFHVWVDSAHQMWRSCIMSAGVVCANVVGVEIFDPSLLIFPATAPVPTWGFTYSQGNTGITTLTGLCGGTGRARLVASGVPSNATLGGFCVVLNGNITGEDGVNLEANGNVPAIRSIGLTSTTVGTRGQIGNRFDWYFSSDNQPNGTTGGGASGKEWIFLCDSTSASGRGLLWPWDGVSTPVTS